MNKTKNRKNGTKKGFFETVFHKHLYDKDLNRVLKAVVNVMPQMTKFSIFANDKGIGLWILE